MEAAGLGWGGGAYGHDGGGERGENEAVACTVGSRRSSAIVVRRGTVDGGEASERGRTRVFRQLKKIHRTNNV